MRIFLLIILFFSVASSAQLLPQTAPTQPSVLIINTKPSPNQTGCSAINGSQCVDTSQYGGSSNSELFDAYCGFDYEFFRTEDNSLLPCNGGVTPDFENGETLNYPISCMACSCPEGQVRTDGICVPDQQCSYGIQDFVTGSCYSQFCPYGDGSPENCGLAPSCVQSENAFLIPANGQTPAACVCSSGTVWSEQNLTCETPLCNGFDNSPIGSTFDLATNACDCSATAILNVETNSCVETTCPNSGEIYSSGVGACVVGLQCPHGYDLNTNTNTCYKISNDLQQCSAINHQVRLAYAVSINAYNATPFNECYMQSSSDADFDFWFEQNNWPGGFSASPYGSTCSGVDSAITGAFYQEHQQRHACESCDTSENYLDLFSETANYSVDGIGRVYFQTSCKTPQYFCVQRNGVWNYDLETCMNGDIQQPPLAISSSSSSQSSAQHSSVFSSSSNISSLQNSSFQNSSLPNGGGGGGSAGSNTSSGGGGDDGGGGDGGGDGGGGGNGTSTASQASASVVASVANSVAQNSSAAASTASTPHASQASANASVANSVSNTSTGCTNCIPASVGSNISQGSNTSIGNGGGGGGASAPSNTSTAANSSASSAGECDPESSDYLDCIGSDKKDFSAHTVTASGATTIDQVNQNYINRLKASPVVTSFTNVSNLIVLSEASCPVFSIDLSDTIIGQIISTEIHCDLMEIIFPILNIVTLIGFAFVGFRIFASA